MTLEEKLMHAESEIAELRRQNNAMSAQQYAYDVIHGEAEDSSEKIIEFLGMLKWFVSHFDFTGIEPIEPDKYFKS